MATLTKYRTTAHNIALAIGGLNGFVSTEVQGSTSVLRMNSSAKNPRPSPIRGPLCVMHKKAETQANKHLKKVHICFLPTLEKKRLDNEF